MGMAICMVELTSIARGIETSDDMIKAAQVTLLRGTTVCPGKYMVIVGGETGAVRAALEAGLAKGGAAQVTLIEVRTGYAVGGKGYFTLTGDVGAVRAAVAAAEKQSELYIGSTVIPRPSKQVLESLL